MPTTISAPIGDRDRVIRTYLPFARRLAGRFAGRGENPDDLVQVAMVGLIKSVDRYDAGRGVPFEHFAGPTIVGELKRHFRDQTWSLRVDRRTRELHRVVKRAAGDLVQQLGRAPTVADIARRLGLAESAVRAGLDSDAAYVTRSLNTGTDEAGTELVELLGGPDARLESVADRYAVRSLIRALPERQRQILLLRYYADLTQAQIARRLDISQAHVSRLIDRALARLRDDLPREPF